MSTMSSCLRATTDSDFETLTSANNNNKIKIKKALLSLGCSSPSSSAASAPSSAATARSSEEWNQGTMTTRRRNIKQQQQQQRNNDKKKKERMEFSDESMDCVVRHHAMLVMMMDHHRGGGGRHDSERIHREIMTFQTRMMSGRMNSYDRYRDWRLDVDRMSYEELLELGDRIGYVDTGLREEEITRRITKMKLSTLDAMPPHFSTEMEKKCSICQEEYEVNDEMGKLECGHGYHMYCIEQWLLQKNACPVCKAAVSTT